jgi:hypothetical protein
LFAADNSGAHHAAMTFDPDEAIELERRHIPEGEAIIDTIR